MTRENPADWAQVQENLDWADLLHQRLGTEIILIDQERGIATLMGGTDLLQAFKEVRSRASLDLLPAPCRVIAAEAAAAGKPIGPRTVELPPERDRKGLMAGITAVPLDEGVRGHPRVALVLIDLTSLSEFEERALQLERLASLGTLAAGMAHEVKNALVACKTFIDLLLEKHQDAELAQIVRREMARIDTIVTRTLKFAGNSTRDLTSVRTHDVLDHCLRLIERQIEDKSITLTRALEAETDLVQGDEHELQQAFVNLLLNAVEAMGPKGTLTVTTRLHPANGAAHNAEVEPEPVQLHVTIQDTGPGIPPEVMARLFEPFVTNKPNGTGLGLAITRRIIHQHRGSVSARSLAGQGTVFTVALPASKIAGQAV